MHGPQPLQVNKHAAFRFVHIPKTGGLAVRRELSRRHKCKDVDFESSRQAHAATEADALGAGKRPILVLREPLDRLHSAFEFWKHGSKMLLSGRPPQGMQLQRTQRSLGFVDFVEGYVNSSSTLHRTVRAITEAPHGLGGWVWSEHFALQARWLNRGSASTVVVCYSATHLKPRLACMGRALRMSCNFSSLKVVNPTSRRAVMPPLPASLLLQLRQRLRKDYALHERHCAGCHPSCPCCHSVGGSVRRGGHRCSLA